MATIRWICDSGNWATRSCWDLNRVPAFADEVIIDVAGDITVTHSAGATAVRSLVSEEALVLAGGTFAPLDATINSTYTQTGGTLGTGTLTVNGLLTWTGGGMTGQGQTQANGGLAISGEALKWLHSRSLVNTGAAVWTDATRPLQFALDAVLHNGEGATFEVRGGAVFEPTAGGGGTFRNDGTFRTAGPPATTIFGDSITFTNGPTGVVQVQTGTLQLLSPPTNFASGTLTGGTWEIAGTFQFPGANLVTNAASLVLDGPNSAIRADAANALVNFSTNAPAGTLVLLNGRTLTHDGNFTNAGLLVVAAGSEIALTGTYAQTGGATALLGGSLGAALVDIQAGVLDGSGLILGDVVNAGLLEVGGNGQAGALFIVGNYTQTKAGVLRIEMGGREPGTEHDVLAIVGTAQLDGELIVDLLPDYMPEVDDLYQFLSFETAQGDFATLNGLDLGDRAFAPFTDESGYYLSVYSV